MRNEAHEISALLDALAVQTRVPDEVIIVDDGSSDGTRAALEARLRTPPAFRIVDAGGVGIGAARNVGIGAASREWIACTDAGCLPVPGWLAAIEEALVGADFVAGTVIFDTHNLTETLVAISAFPRPDELADPSPAVRVSHALFGRGASPDRTGGGYMAFRRSVWEAIGGFPSGLRASDDRAFSVLVADAGFRMVQDPRAAVRWRPRATLAANLGMFFNYARGDVHIRPRRRHVARAVAYGVGAVVALRGQRRSRAAMAACGLAYVWLPLRRARRDGLSIRRSWLIPVVIGLKDLAQLAGAATGLFDRLVR